MKTALLASALILSTPAHAQRSDTLAVKADGWVAGTLNGANLVFFMTPNGIGLPVINPKVAQDLALKRSIFAIQARVGPSKIAGHTGVVKLAVGGGEAKKRILWFDAPQRAGFGGVLGPDAVPQARVVFDLAPGAGGATKAYELPIARQTNRVGTLIDVGGRRIFVQWDLTRRQSLATAGAAAAIAAAHGGALSGERRSEVIEFGVARPVQSLKLARPLRIGPLQLGAIDARVSDYGSTTGIRSEDEDPSEIVVTADAKKKDRAVYSLTIGAGDLAQCARIEFDKTAGVVRLFCA